MKKLKTKNGDAKKKWSSNKVRGLSPEAGRVYGWKDLRKSLKPGMKERGSYGW